MCDIIYLEEYDTGEVMTNTTEYFISPDDSRTHCFYIAFDLDDNNNLHQVVEDWSEEIFDQIASFAFGKGRELERADTSSPRRAHIKGRKLLYEIKEIKEANDYYTGTQFTENDDKYIKRGEFGELILYYLLSVKLNKPQLIPKLYFKDSYNSVVHGFDAVHYDPDTNNLWIGESKFYKNKNSALTELADDLVKHFNIDFFNQEFTIINNRFNDLNINNNDIKKIIDPEGRFISKLIKINACFFALFDSNILKTFKFKEGTDEVSDEFKLKLSEAMKKTRAAFDDKISNFPNKNNLKIHLFLFPVESKNELVRKLHLKLKKESEV